MRRRKKPAAVTLIRGERSLEFFNGQLLYRSRNGVAEQYKFLSLAAVAAAFRNAPIDTGWMPPGVARCGSTSQGDFALLFIPARTHPLEIEDPTGSRTRVLPVPLPSLAFFGIGPSFAVWAVKEKAALDPSAKFFRAPLPNVFADGSICWGSNQPPRASASTIAKAWELFITSPFSGHAANNKARGYASDVRPLLRLIARKRQPFPLKELIATGGTVEATVSHLIGGKTQDEPLFGFVGEGEE